MEIEEIFKVIQEYTSNPPLILAGTGLTIPIGIPGMSVLADYLQKQLDKKYNNHPAWINVTQKLNSGIDLETALSEDKLGDDLLDDVKKSTWELINKSDIEFFKGHHLKGHKGAFATLIGKFLRTTGHHLDIITTNYDRYIEYCCEHYDVVVDTGYNGIYKKSLDMSFSKRNNSITLLKVHGSLDSFKNNKTNERYSIPLQETIPSDYTPEIITPGIGKYQDILKNASRQLLYQADTVINNSTNFLCIGYGFNDSQIQELIIKRIRYGYPIVIVTKELSNDALKLITDNSENHALILDGKDGKTRFIINNTEAIIDGEYWTMDGFNKII